jgi:hypothetical protein
MDPKPPFDANGRGRCREGKQPSRPSRQKCQPSGVYQMGEVQARSWIDVGRPSGTSTPSVLASYVDQRRRDLQDPRVVQRRLRRIEVGIRPGRHEFGRADVVGVAR